jgi:DNA-binding NtrC family response regulator
MASVVPVSTLPLARRIRPRTALVASSDRSFRQRLSETLTGLRWQVQEAEGGAQAWEKAEEATPEAVIVDSWLPDLDLAEFLKDFRAFFPEVDLVTTSGSISQESPRGPYRQELLYALRRSQDNDTAIWNAAPTLMQNPPLNSGHVSPWPVTAHPAVAPAAASPQSAEYPQPAAPQALPAGAALPSPETEKEIVAEALHRLSPRSRKPFVAINCAAIPEALLEAELFGHTRGAFTGAVQGRVGRIEAAEGGTLFLDEIGEMPLALQSKLLRFVECGELQRVGDNDTTKVDVRILAATHQALAQQVQDGGFRADLYYRLAVFLIRTPSLAQHAEDLPLLVNHFLAQMGREAPVKKVDEGALEKLALHDWPGNVRELEHVLERAAILAGEESVLTAREIDFGFAIN